MNRKSDIHIVSACDDNFAQHLGVAIASLLENCRYTDNIVYNIIDDGISIVNKNKLVNLVKRYKARIEFLELDKRIFKGLPTTQNWPVAIYYRILTPQLFDDSIRKLIYLDCDVVIKDDITKLWEANVDNYSVAAVADNHGSLRLSDLNMPEDSLYFNSGVLVINLEFWRKHNIEEKIIEYISHYKNRLLWPDQDALNAILFNKWKQLEPKWNVQRNMIELLPQDQVFNIDMVNDALEKPSIIHFTTSSKPWFYYDQHPMKKEYYHYLSFTEWKNFKPVDKNFRKGIKKAIKSILPSPIFKILKKIV